jgi:hypothetical protein
VIPNVSEELITSIFLYPEDGGNKLSKASIITYKTIQCYNPEDHNTMIYPRKPEILTTTVTTGNRISV